MRCLISSLFIIALLPNPVKAGFLLTGQIRAAENQTFYSPKTDSWRVQIQWMLPEGEVAEQGDLVVVFDSGSIETQIEQKTLSLINAQEELERITYSGKQSLLEAEYGLKREELLLEKARLEASIPEQHLSQFDYEENQLEFEKALIAKVKAEQSLAQIKVANDVAIQKQQLTINQQQQQLDYQRKKLSQMNLYAERKGPVLYGNHPWTGEKVFVGMTAQPSWNIAEIPSLSGLYIEAWVHEIDRKHLNLNSEASLVFDAFPSQSLVAKLTEISSQPEERLQWGNDVYYRVLFSFSNTEKLKLLPGMSAQLELKDTKNG